MDQQAFVAIFPLRDAHTSMAIGLLLGQLEDQNTACRVPPVPLPPIKNARWMETEHWIYEESMRHLSYKNSKPTDHFFSTIKSTAAPCISLLCCQNITQCTKRFGETKNSLVKTTFGNFPGSSPTRIMRKLIPLAATLPSPAVQDVGHVGYRAWLLARWYAEFGHSPAVGQVYCFPSVEEVFDGNDYESPTPLPPPLAERYVLLTDREAHAAEKSREGKDEGV